MWQQWLLTLLYRQVSTETMAWHHCHKSHVDSCLVQTAAAECELHQISTLDTPTSRHTGTWQQSHMRTANYVFRRAKHLSISPSHPANSASLTQWEREISTVQWWCCVAGEQRQDGSFHMWINVWVAGKTVWSLVNTRQPQRFRTTWVSRH